MFGLFYFEEDSTFSVDEVIHKTRGKYWDKATKSKFEANKKKAEAMLRNDQPNNIFFIARICHLDVMTVRDLEKVYLAEMKCKVENV